MRSGVASRLTVASAARIDATQRATSSSSCGVTNTTSALDAAKRHGFQLTEELDLTEAAAPTIDYFNVRIPRYREKLIADIGITSEQVDDLITSGFRYRSMYGDGTYGYRLLQFRRG